jgi:hypothetical protein
MIATSSASLSPNERPTGLHARCVTCGAIASDWRQLLGLGASVAAPSADSHGVLLTFPGACARCGASKLLVDITPSAGWTACPSLVLAQQRNRVV